MNEIKNCEVCSSPLNDAGVYINIINNHGSYKMLICGACKHQDIIQIGDIILGKCYECESYKPLNAENFVMQGKGFCDMCISCYTLQQGILDESVIQYETHASNIYKIPAFIKPINESKLQDVYFIQEGNEGPIKIGIASNVQERLRTLQTAHAKLLNIRGIIKHGGLKTESELHNYFHKYHLHGEWFALNNEIVDLINKIPKQ
jgi:hypothetical protein